MECQPVPGVFLRSLFGLFLFRERAQKIDFFGASCGKNNYLHITNQHMAFKQDKPEDCPVCYESINSQKEALECGHWVHTECIVKSTKAQCPICRRSLVLNPKDIESLDLKYKREIIEKAQRNLLGHSTQMSSSSSSHYMERKKIDYSITTYSEKLAKFKQEVDPLVRLLAELAEAAAKFSTAKARIFPVRGDGNP